MLPKFSSQFCPADKGFGGPLACLKNKILKECREFHAWRTDMLTERSQEKLLSEDKNDEQGFITLNSFIDGVESLNTSLLLAVQRLTKTAENNSKESSIEGKDAGVNETGPDETVQNLQLQDRHLTTLLHQRLLDDINSLDVNNVTKAISSLMSQLKDMADLKGPACSSPFQLSSIGFCTQLLSSSIPLLHQYLNLSQNLLVNLLAAHRATSKLLSVLLSIFTDLASKGFCLPPEIEEGEGDGATEFEDIEGGGIGEGEGMKDVSDQIENEDQLEDTKQEGQEQEKKDENPQQQIPDEENGIEMSENFEGALHDVETGEEEENENSEEENEDESEVDKQMGEVDGQDTEKLDEKMWGDSDEEDEKEEQLQEMKEEKGTGAEAESQSQLVAKEDNKGSTEESKEKADQQPGDDEDQNEEKLNQADEDEERNMSDEGEDDQEGTGQQGQEGPPDTDEPANLDLPDDLQLDEEGNEGSEDQGEEMNTEDIEKDEENTAEAEDESPGVIDEEMDAKEDGEEEQMAEEERTEGMEGSEKQDEGESPKEEDAVAETDQEDWKTNADTRSQDNAQAVEDSGEGEEIGEQSDITAGQSESTEDSEEQGVGRAEAPNNQGHHGESRQNTVQAPSDTNQQSRQRKKMNRARSDRTLGSMDETTHKRLKTVDKTEQEPGAEANKTTSQDLFQHMQNEDPSTHDAQTLDSATADQAKEQEKAHLPEMHSDAEDEEEKEMKSALLEENNELSASDIPQQSRLPPPIKPQITADNEDGSDAPESEAHEMDMETNDGEEITAERMRSTYHSSDMALAFERLDISSLDPEKLRSDLEHQLAEWSNMDRGTAEEQQAAQEAWRKYEFLTSSLSQELCEQLRLVLEPSLATKLKGDYRSGKRLNMRKVIPYIASQFRKDKIWLRRTKPSKRQYQIMLAVDDSSSMNDNHSKQLAFESLAVISNALTRLEAGDLGVCRFGETVRLLHPFHESFTDHSGARILQQFTFDQKKTKIAQLLDTCTSLMLSAHSRLQVSPRMRRDTSQLLLIVSDGRGIFLEGMETVQKAVRIAREASIFMVFVILDNPANKDSVLDIRVPIFRPGKLPEIKSYMEQFPFPFYIILRDINALPLTLSDALRQWFELVSSMD